MKKLIPLVVIVSLVALLAGNAEQLEAQNGRFDFGHGITLEYHIVPFDNKVFRQKGGEIGPVYGVDGGGPPSTKLEKLVLRRGKSVTQLEVSCMYEPAAGKMLKSQLHVRLINARSMTLTGSFSDAAGSYVAKWLIVDGIGVRTILSDDPEIVSCVESHPE